MAGLLQEICRSLHLDLRGQTSASYNMRLNYEKCLLDFEKYLTSGRYTADLAVGTAPPTDVLEPAPAIKPSQGGAAAGSEPHNSGYSTRGASRVAAGQPYPGQPTSDLPPYRTASRPSITLPYPTTSHTSQVPPLSCIVGVYLESAGSTLSCAHLRTSCVCCSKARY